MDVLHAVSREPEMAFLAAFHGTMDSGMVFRKLCLPGFGPERSVACSFVCTFRMSESCIQAREAVQKRGLRNCRRCI